VDDLLIFTPKGSPFFSKIKEVLFKEFEMKDLREAKSFLSMEITRDRSKHMITLSQKEYIENVLEHFSYTKANPCWMPMVSHCLEKLTKTGNPKEYNPREEVYWSIIRSLMYLMIATRLDLDNSVSIISRYLANLSKEHLTAAKHILHYVKGTKDYTLTLGPSAEGSFNLHGYTDADWDNDVDTRKSTTSYVFYAGNGAIS